MRSTATVQASAGQCLGSARSRLHPAASPCGVREPDGTDERGRTGPKASLDAALPAVYLIRPDKARHCSQSYHTVPTPDSAALVTDEGMV